MLDSLSHVSIVVPDLEAATARLSHVYGLSVGDVLLNPEQGVRLAYIDLGNTRLELMQPMFSDSAMGRFLQKNPAGGLHHISFAVDSIRQVGEALALHQVATIGQADTKNVHGETIAFIHPKDFLGTLVELEERKHSPLNP